MSFEKKQITIGQNEYWITSDPGYSKHLGERFEPNTVALLEALCDKDSQVLDIGANIGITGIAIAQLASQGKVVAIEPVPATYKLLTNNIKNSNHSNISTHNFALGNKYSEIKMQGNPDNLSGAFVADIHTIDDGYHFSETVKQYRLDEIFNTLGLNRIDFIKMDVEGYELDVLEGATSLLSLHQPTVLLEMNYVSLNLWRGISITEFRNRLLNIFPFVYAVQENEYLDFRDSKQSHSIQFRHLTKWDFMDLVAGFNKEALLDRLQRLPDIRQRNEKAAMYRDNLNLANQRVATLQNELQESIQRVANIEASNSWKITRPLRNLISIFK